MAADIDALFTGMTARKATAKAGVSAAAAAAAAREAAAAAEAAAAERAIAALEAAGRRTNRMSGGDSPVPLRWDKALGVKVYSLEGLRIGQGRGDTPLCPIDCDCCF
jgi:hypothetical protein